MTGPRPVTPAVRARAIADVMILLSRLRDRVEPAGIDADGTVVLPGLTLPADTDGLPVIASRAVADTLAEMARGPGAATAILDGLGRRGRRDDDGPVEAMWRQMSRAEREGAIYELHGAELSFVVDLVMGAHGMEHAVSMARAAEEGSENRRQAAQWANEDAQAICAVVRAAADRQYEPPGGTPPPTGRRLHQRQVPGCACADCAGAPAASA